MIIQNYHCYRCSYSYEKISKFAEYLISLRHDFSLKIYFYDALGAMLARNIVGTVRYEIKRTL